MPDNFEEFLTKLENELPDLVSNDNLVKLGLTNIILFRLREKKALPFLKLSSARILYMKNDVIDWLRRSFQTKDCLEGCVRSDSKK